VRLLTGREWRKTIAKLSDCPFFVVIDQYQSRVTVLMFTDLVDSTALQQVVGTPAFLDALARHDDLYREIVVARYKGRILNHMGDGFLTELPSPSEAVRAALLFQWRLARAEWGATPLRARCALHLGELTESAAAGSEQGRFGGMAINAAARLMDLGAAGQILVSRAIFDDARRNVREHPATLDDPSPDPRLGLRWEAHGRYLFKGADEPIEVFEVGVPGISPLSPPGGSAKARRYLSPEEEATLGWRPGVGLEIPRREGWLLERKLGEGAFGEVWLARHRRLKEVRVFKFCFDAERLRSFRRELTLFRLLRKALGDREDIVRLFEVQVESAPFYLESEFTPDGNLITWAESKGGLSQVPLDVRLQLVSTIARAAAAAHSIGIIHKDIKPSNILITGTGNGARAKLGDFGIGVLSELSRLIEQNITVAGFTGMLHDDDSSRTGTRLYSAPEYLAGAAASVQGDVYALGVLLYQMVIADLNRPLASGWERDLTDELLREDIAASVEGDPSRRLNSALELARRLDDLPERRAQRQRERDLARAAEAEGRRAGRRRVALRLAVAGAVALAAITVALAWGYRARKLERDRAITARKEAETLVRFLIFEMKDRLVSAGKSDLLADINRKAAGYYQHVGYANLDKESFHLFVTGVGQLALVMMDQGDVPGAMKLTEPILRQAQERLNVAKDTVFRSDVVFLLGVMGDARRLSGDLQAAEGLFKEALALDRGLLVDKPDKKDEILGMLSVQLDRLATLAAHQRQFTQALAYRGESLAIGRALASAKPGDVIVQEDLATDLASMAELLRLTGQVEEGIKFARESRDLRERLARQAPEDAQLAAGRVKGAGALLEPLVQAGRWPEAEDILVGAIPVAEKVAAKDPRNLEWQRNLGALLSSGSAVSLNLGQLDKAGQRARGALEVAEANIKVDPGRPQRKEDIALALKDVAKVETTLDHPETARQLLERALALLKELSIATPAEAAYSIQVATTAADLAKLHAKRGEAGINEARRMNTLSRDILRGLKSRGQLATEENNVLAEVESALRQNLP
jgi:class 3 adenylate cyclase/tetratricopeptide (TPR) repeat protein